MLSMISIFNQLSGYTIFIIALRDPNTNAIMLITHIIIFFTATQLAGPKPVSQYVTISISAGIKSPNMEKQNAPIKLMKGPIFGTATASNTGKRKKNNIDN